MSQGDDSISLREWMTEKFLAIQKQLDALTATVVGRERFDLWCNRVTMLETEVAENDRRLMKLEKSIWLMQILVGLLLPIVTAVVIAVVVAWVTGSMEVRFTR